MGPRNLLGGRLAGGLVNGEWRAAHARRGIECETRDMISQRVAALPKSPGHSQASTMVKSGGAGAALKINFSDRDRVIHKK